MLRPLHSLRALLIAGIAGASMLAGSTTAFAGASDNRPASCTFNVDGSGYCSGSLRAFRTSPDSTAYVTFSSYQGSVGNPERWIYVRFNGTFKSIQALSTLPAGLLTHFDRVATAVDAHIDFSWNVVNGSNRLTGLQVFNDSKLLP